MAIAELAYASGNDNAKIRAEIEGEEYVQSDYYSPDEIMQKYKDLQKETKRLRDENEKLKDKIKMLTKK